MYWRIQPTGVHCGAYLIRRRTRHERAYLLACMQSFFVEFLCYIVNHSEDF